MFDWWLNSEGFSKYILPIVLLAISTILWFAGYYWPWGWAVGGVLLVASMIFSKDKSGWENGDGQEGEEEGKTAFEAATSVDPDQQNHLCMSCKKFNDRFSLCGQFQLEINTSIATCKEFETR